MLRRSPELEEEEEDVVDMMRLLPSPLPASEDAALQVEAEVGRKLSKLSREAYASF